MAKPVEILSQYWGHAAFRPGQEDIVNSVLEGDDVLALLPTGGGKSICFQVPAMMREGICIVVTPLIALMQDQVDQLNKRGIKAIAINASMSPKEIDIKLDNCVYGAVKFLYVSPERLKTDLFRARLANMKVGLLAIDEAHCISQWGYDFRPSYLEIAEIREVIPDVNVIALTATATEKVKIDIQEKLLFKKQHVFQKSFARDNLSYSVRRVEDKERKLLEVLKNVMGSAIVYVNTRKATKELATLLYKNGISADYYHAGLSYEDRKDKQQKWQNNRIRVVVATNAFGMGIDKPDVRIVIHMSLTQDLESYYQEAGRAGRDQKKAYALILYNDADVKELVEKLKLQYPELTLIKRTYQCLANYYKLAVGSGTDQSFDFDIHEFSESYQLNHLQVYYVLKKLEEAELILFNESFHQPSQLNFNVDNKALYEFQIAQGRFDPLIKTILRVYGGELFSNFLKISENQLARQLETTEQKIVEALNALVGFGIINCNQKKDKPQLTFVQQRFAVESLPLNVKRLKEREENARSKIEGVTKYLVNDHQCRTAQLLAYFGETSYDHCGICDVCIQQKKSGHVEHLEQYRLQIDHIVREEPIPVEVLVDTINPPNKEELLELVREMVDANELTYDDQWRLVKAGR
ncbi:MAG: ATP-dependent DNA helicase RecQ [Fulvivirga sp.]